MRARNIKPWRIMKLSDGNWQTYTINDDMCYKTLYGVKITVQCEHPILCSSQKTDTRYSILTIPTFMTHLQNTNNRIKERHLNYSLLLDRIWSDMKLTTVQGLCLEIWREALESKWFLISRNKTKYMECNFSGIKNIKNRELKIENQKIK